MENIVEIQLSTRPDCISQQTVKLLQQVSEETGKNITVELGLQSVNSKTLETIKRGHTLAEFIDAVLTLHMYHIPVTAHIIADLPWDTREDVIECAKVLSALRIEGVKIHSLYVPMGTILEKLYTEGRISLLNEDDFVGRAVAFLCYADPDMVIHRLIGRIPPQDSVMANFSRSWWVIKEKIESVMMSNGLFQGIYFNYLDGSALRRKGY